MGVGASRAMGMGGTGDTGGTKREGGRARGARRAAGRRRDVIYYLNQATGGSIVLTIALATP